MEAAPREDFRPALSRSRPFAHGCAASRVIDMEARMSTKLDVDVTELWREFKDRPTTPLRNRLVERYLPLGKYNAERIWQRLPGGVDLDDLISAGVFGLMDAIDAFDLGRGVKFETYCVPRIRGAMLDELRPRGWACPSRNTRRWPPTPTPSASSRSTRSGTRPTATRTSARSTSSRTRR